MFRSVYLKLCVCESVGRTTNPNLTTRNTTIKKDKEIFDQQRSSIKSPSTGGINLGVKDELDEFSDEYDDEYSYSLSGQSTPIPPTPEPTKTPTPSFATDMYFKSPSPHIEKVNSIKILDESILSKISDCRKATSTYHV